MNSCGCTSSEDDKKQSQQSTPEFKSFRRFVALHGSDPLGAFPPSAVRVPRIAILRPGDEVEFLGGTGAADEQGRPVIISEALSAWPALRTWTPAYLAERFGDDEVFANDRAPARASDAEEGRPQVTLRLKLRDYISYYSDAIAAAAPPVVRRGSYQQQEKAAAGCSSSAAQSNCSGSRNEEEKKSSADGAAGADEEEAEEAAPFYLNGWAALAAHPVEISADCPTPPFSELVDHSDIILQQLDKQLFSKKPSALAPAPAATATAEVATASVGPTSGGATSQQQQQQQQQQDPPPGPPPPQLLWWQRLSLGLSKLFLGPAGTVTRLHYDAGDAHGWLGQIWGRKLFILYPPSATASLYPLNADAGAQRNKAVTVQSPVDPLGIDLSLYPLAGALEPHVAVLEPGEAILIPRGWWHFAVALDPSLTAMRNFYSADSNAAAMVQFVMSKVRGLALAAGGSGGARPPQQASQQKLQAQRQ